MHAPIMAPDQSIDHVFSYLADLRDGPNARRHCVRWPLPLPVLGWNMRGKEARAVTRFHHTHTHTQSAGRSSLAEIERGHDTHTYTFRCTLLNKSNPMCVWLSKRTIEMEGFSNKLDPLSQMPCLVIFLSFATSPRSSTQNPQRGTSISANALLPSSQSLINHTQLPRPGSRRAATRALRLAALCFVAFFSNFPFIPKN